MQHPTSSSLMQRRQWMLRTLMCGFGVATLSMLPTLAALVSPTHNAIYHLDGPASAVFVPALFDLALLAALMAALLFVCRPHTRWGTAVWAACFFFAPWIALKNITTLYDLHFPHPVSLCVFGLGLVCTAAATACWSPGRALMYSRGVGLGTSLLGTVALFGTILTLQLLWFFWKARDLNEPGAGTASAFGEPFTASPSPASIATHPRVLWIVFDEMSQDQAIDSRAEGLHLPNLDRFVAQASLFPNVVPAGVYTEMVFPTLMSGFEDDAIRISADGRTVHLHESGAGQQHTGWSTFDPSQTIFADAVKLGYHSGVVGWYNPYCRLLAGVLRSCFWTGESNLSSVFPFRTIHQNLFRPAIRVLTDIPIFFFPQRFPPNRQGDMARLHIADYRALSTAADAALADPSLDFLLLHLPIPHPDGIYDRKTQQLTDSGDATYLDNLALVDRYLGHLRAILEGQHAWDNTTVLIMGDHSWRTRLLWQDGPGWTSEEEKASHGGQFDDRPFYAVKLAHQSAAATMDKPFRAKDTRALLDQLLNRSIATPEQLSQWVQTPH